MFDPFPIHRLSAVPVPAQADVSACPAPLPPAEEMEDANAGLGGLGDGPSLDPAPTAEADLAGDADPGGWAPPPVRAAMQHNGFSPERQARFLDALAGSGNVRMACTRTAISAQTAYKARRRDGRFAAAWDAALVLARDHAETVLASRALDGVEEAVFYHGEEVARRRRYDSRLLLAHLERLDRRCEGQDSAVLASRFDELLAAIAGLEPSAVLHDGGICDGDAEEEPIAGLGAPRAEWIEQCETDAVWDAEDALDALVDTADEGAGPDDGALIHHTAQAARVAAAAQWDAHHARACALVDRLGEGDGGDGGGGGSGGLICPDSPPFEVKSMPAAMGHTGSGEGAADFSFQALSPVSPPGEWTARCETLFPEREKRRNQAPSVQERIRVRPHANGEVL